MKGQTKILVLRMKEVIYTLIFLGLGIILIFLFLHMFRDKSDVTEPETVETASYIAGIYTSTLNFQDKELEVQVVVDENHINDISFVNLDETVAAMYPLMEPTIESLKTQICEKQSTSDLSFDEDSRYTCSMLLQAVDEALAKANRNE